jgi:hypothetical protein
MPQVPIGTQEVPVLNEKDLSQGPQLGEAWPIFPGKRGNPHEHVINIHWNII